MPLRLSLCPAPIVTLTLALPSPVTPLSAPVRLPCTGYLVPHASSTISLPTHIVYPAPAQHPPFFSKHECAAPRGKPSIPAAVPVLSVPVAHPHMCASPAAFATSAMPVYILHLPTAQVEPPPTWLPFSHAPCTLQYTHPSLHARGCTVETGGSMGARHSQVDALPQFACCGGGASGGRPVQGGPNALPTPTSSCSAPCCCSSCCWERRAVARSRLGRRSWQRQPLRRQRTSYTCRAAFPETRMVDR